MGKERAVENKMNKNKNVIATASQKNENANVIATASQVNKNNIEIKLASIEHAAQIYGVMKQVYEQLEDKTLYVCDSFEYVKAHITEEGFIVIACSEEEKIVGSFIVRYPGLNEDNLGRDIGLKEEQLLQVVHMESVVVLPEYRGRGLQLAMLNFAEEQIDKEKYNYLMATVSPDNPWSYRSFEQKGYELKLTKNKYEGLERRIYLKEIRRYHSVKYFL